MKAITNLVRLTTAMVFLMFIFSCSDGEDGAIGPQGPQGEQGPQGAQGDQGEQGEAGTANVIYSEWIARNFFIAGANEENFQGLEVLNDTEFNPDTDVVLVFGRRGEEGSVEIYQLPYLLISQDEWYGFGLLTASGGLSLQVRVRTLDGGTNIFTFFDEFRYVIIPGGVAKSSLNYQNMSYQEIVSLFDIK